MGVTPEQQADVLAEAGPTSSALTAATTSPDICAYVPRHATASANYIGGCCRISPAFIRAVRATLDAL